MKVTEFENRKLHCEPNHALKIELSAWLMTIVGTVKVVAFRVFKSKSLIQPVVIYAWAKYVIRISGQKIK